MAHKKGKVYVVGGGPGDPGLFTVRGVECLRRADLVLYDYLVNPRILEHAPAGVEQICLGKHGRSRIWPQHEINQKMVEAARQGRIVVRLKGGDPAVFARLAEELEALIQADVPFEIVPGITAALAASSYAGVPVTHRDWASAVALVTAHEMEAKDASSLSYQALARFPGTLVFYMGVTTAPQWTQALIRAGKPVETPAVILRRCSFSDQHRIDCRLGDVAEQLTPASRLRPPVIVVVGEVAGVADRYSWFERRPLFGQTVLVTRPRAQAGGLAKPLEEAGAEVLVQPAIRIDDPADWTPVDEALRSLRDFNWLVFSSANGVHRTLRRFGELGLDLRALGQIQIATIGAATSATLSEYYLQADLQPDEFRAEALAEALAERAAGGGRCLLIRASRGREVLAETLRAAGADVHQVVVYESSDVTEVDSQIRERFESGSIDWVTVTSSAIARALGKLWGPLLGQTRLVSISPVTSATLRELGWEPAAEAAEYTMTGVVDALLAAQRG